MRGILADNDIRGHVRLLVNILQAEPWLGFWNDLDLTVESFASLGLSDDASDEQVWLTCQEQQVVLITANRTAKEPDSLENTIRRRNSTTSLPVLTLASPKRILKVKSYGKKIAERLLGYLLDMEKHRGAGRVFLA